MLVADRKQTTRLLSWKNLREKLEQSDNPLEEVTNYFLNLPKVKFYTDPYDQSTWPTPWELIDENEYCQFNIILGICYTLQLTERFKNIQPKINVAIDKINKTVYYMLLLDDKVYGYSPDEWIYIDDLPKTLKVQKNYTMKPLY